MFDIQKILSSSVEERKTMVFNALIDRIKTEKEKHGKNIILVVSHTEEGKPTYKMLLKHSNQYIEYSGLLHFIGIPTALLNIAKTMLPESVFNSILNIEENINSFLETYKAIGISEDNNELFVTYKKDGDILIVCADEFLEDLM